MCSLFRRIADVVVGVFNHLFVYQGDVILMSHVVRSRPRTTRLLNLAQTVQCFPLACETSLLFISPDTFLKF